MLPLTEIPDCPDEPEPLTAEIPSELWARFYYAREKAAAWTQVAKDARAQIEEHMGDAVLGTVRGVPTVNWGWRQTRRLDQRALKADHPELVEKYTKAAEERRFEPVEQAA